MVISVKKKKKYKNKKLKKERIIHQCSGFAVAKIFMTFLLIFFFFLIVLLSSPIFLYTFPCLNTSLGQNQHIVHQVFLIKNVKSGKSHVHFLSNASITCHLNSTFHQKYHHPRLFLDLYISYQ